MCNDVEESDLNIEKGDDVIEKKGRFIYRRKI